MPEERFGVKGRFAWSGFGSGRGRLGQCLVGLVSVVVDGCGCRHLIPLVRWAALWGVLGHAFASLSVVGEGHGAVRLGQSLGSIT
jgi:hypothetical protein